MAEIRNNGKRRLGISGRRSLILDPGATATIDDGELAQLRQNNKTLNRWIQNGLITVDGKSTPAPSPVEGPKENNGDKKLNVPEGLTGKGFETHHEGGGWYSAYVNGFKVTDKNLREDDVEALAKEYE